MMEDARHMTKMTGSKYLKIHIYRSVVVEDI
jgi:hypothetical protein